MINEFFKSRPIGDPGGSDVDPAELNLGTPVHQTVPTAQIDDRRFVANRNVKCHNKMLCDQSRANKIWRIVHIDSRQLLCRFHHK